MLAQLSIFPLLLHPALITNLVAFRLAHATKCKVVVRSREMTATCSRARAPLSHFLLFHIVRPRFPPPFTFSPSLYRMLGGLSFCLPLPLPLPSIDDKCDAKPNLCFLLPSLAFL